MNNFGLGGDFSALKRSKVIDFHFYGCKYVVPIDQTDKGKAYGSICCGEYNATVDDTIGIAQFLRIKEFCFGISLFDIDQVHVKQLPERGVCFSLRQQRLFVVAVRLVLRRDGRVEVVAPAGELETVVAEIGRLLYQFCRFARFPFVR